MGRVIARTPLVWPLGALAAFGVVLVLVLAGWAPLRHLDIAVSEAFRAYGEAHAGLVAFVREATDVMATGTFLAVGCAAAVLLVAAGDRRAAGFCAAVTVTIPALWGLAHWLLYRPRPTVGFVTIDSNGFPSGHTSHAAATALAAALVLWPRLRATGRMLTVVAGVAFAVAIGTTRVVLLAHWPSDVLGGWLLAAAVVPLLAAAFAPRRFASAGRGTVRGDGRSPA